MFKICLVKIKPKLLLFLLTGVVFLFNGNRISAQSNQSPVLVNDTTKIHSPKKAAISSAILPGLGQAYNKKYWKIPIIYAGLGFCTYSVINQNQNYNSYRQEYITRIKEGVSFVNPEYSNYSLSDLTILQDYHRRTRDLFIIGTAAVYVLNIIDASVDAHLFTFDVSEDLSLDLRPEILPNYSSKEVFPAISLKLTF